MPALALTDHGNLFGAIEFYQRAIKTGVKPIVGYEAYVAPKSMEDREARVRDGEGTNNHLVLLVKNEQGYKNLIRLASLAYTKGFYYKPRIDLETLKKHHDGLICLSGCLSGRFAQLAQRDEKQAFACASEYRDVFGKENYFLELQDHGLEEEEIVNRVALDVAKRLDVGVVATQDAHYIRKEDAHAHDVLLAIATNRPVDDTGRMRFPNEQFWFKSTEEMAFLFRDTPQALENTIAIAERCSLEIDFTKQHLPQWVPPDGKTPPQFLRELCTKGLEERYPKAQKPIRDRLDYELSVIGKMGFESYFLIVWDFIRYAREQGIPVGPGRGSAAGSVVAYCLAITELDPLAYDLIFERFLNPGRKEMPDIDIDFCQQRREEVIDYVRRRYGKENVGQIVTYSTLGAKAVVRNVGKAIGLPYAEQDALAKKIPFGPKMTLKEAMKLEPELGQLAKKDPRVQEIFDISETLEGIAKATSVHAAGVVISDKPLAELVPVHVADGVEITQYSMNTLGSLGLLKMDFLGLQTLTILQKAVEIIRAVRKINVDLPKLPLDDKRTYEMLARAETKGVFQLESGGMRDLLTKLKPDRFEDLIAVLALYRPGVIQAGGMIDTYIEVKHGVREASYPHPSLEQVLRETNGVILYQEQVMRVAAELSGFSLADADGLRKAMGKKKPEIMEKYRQQFIDGGKKKGVSEDLATQIWNLLEHFGGYGFNKSHSAAYALVTYRTAYLKANYPVEYMAAVMTTERGDNEKVVEYMDECRRLGIPVDPPDLNESGIEFTIKDGRIRFGLGAVRNVGERALQTFLDARKQHGRFTSLFQLCEDVDLKLISRDVLRSLVHCGALDGLGARRAQLAEAVDSAVSFGQSLQQDRRAGQAMLFGASMANAAKPTLPDVPEWPTEELLAKEKASLGFYVTSHPLAKYELLVQSFSTHRSSEIPKAPDGSEVMVGGVIAELSYTMLKKGKSAGKRMAKFLLKDLHGGVHAIAFPGEVEKFRDQIAEDRLVFARGKIDFRRSDEPTIKVDSIVPIERATEELTGSVTVCLKAPGLEERTVLALKDLVLAHPGGCALFLEVATGDGHRATIRASTDFMVTPTHRFLEDVEELVGEGTLRLSAR